MQAGRGRPLPSLGTATRVVGSAAAPGERHATKRESVTTGTVCSVLENFLVNFLFEISILTFWDFKGFPRLPP